ncbi:MAG: hypothetical protein HS116_26960 [Planctomycetes bacterium]|nr:hypothetical protein [Planctomycetota bacterium]
MTVVSGAFFAHAIISYNPKAWYILPFFWAALVCATIEAWSFRVKVSSDFIYVRYFLFWRKIDCSAFAYHQTSNEDRFYVENDRGQQFWFIGPIAGFESLKDETQRVCGVAAQKTVKPPEAPDEPQK